MFSTKFISDAGERAVKTIAQSILSYIIASGALGLFELSLYSILSVSLLAGLVSLLTSIVSSGVGSEDDASLVK